MRKIIATALLSGFVLTGCGSEGDDTAAEEPPPAPSGSPTGTLAVETGGDETGTLKDRAAFLQAMRQIDPRLVRDENRAVTIAQNLCRELQQGTKPVTVAAHAAVRYSGDGLVVDMAPSKQIVKALQQHACRP